MKNTESLQDIDNDGMADHVPEFRAPARHDCGIGGVDALATRERNMSPAIEIVAERPAPVIPVPRRSRMFVRHGEGHGAFSNVTLTGPVRSAQA